MTQEKSLKDTLSGKTSSDKTLRPEFFSLSNEEDRKKLEVLLEKGAISDVSDDYTEQLAELFSVENPNLVYTSQFKTKQSAYIEQCGQLLEHGVWVYFPWRSGLAHILSEEDFLKVRTARNKLLIDQKEQENFYNATIGIAGLSVGSNIAFALALQGGPRRIRLADMDRLALSNTNRVFASVSDLGLLKVEMVARRLYEINPYLTIELYPDGLSEQNLELFFNGLDVVVDELDNLAVKYLIRTCAQKHRIPVVMGADNGDNAVIDVERYDLNPNTKYFHGRLGNITIEELRGLDKFGIGKTITQHIGPENVTPRMQQSLLEMGKTIVSWPQLGGAALLNGIAVAYCVKKILNNQDVIDNRALLIMDKDLSPSYNSPEEQKRREETSVTFKKMFGL